MPWDGYSMMNWFPFFGFWMMAFWLIILIVAAYLIYRLITAGSKIPVSGAPGRTAEEILAERYARGELTREEYLRMRDDLKESKGK